MISSAAGRHRRRVVAQPGADAVRRTGGVGAGRTHVLRLARPVPDLDGDQAARVEATADQGEPGRGAGHHTGRPGERAQRDQLGVHDRGQQQRRGVLVAGDQAGQRVDPVGAGGRAGPGRRRVRRRAAASTCSLARTWRGARGQRSTRPPTPSATRSAPCTHRVGDRAAAYVVEVVAVTLERGAGDRRPQAGLGGDLPAVPAQRAMPQRGVDPVAGRGQGGRDIGEVEQRSEGIHPNTVTGKASETRGAQTGVEVARFAQHRSRRSSARATRRRARCAAISPAPPAELVCNEADPGQAEEPPS